MKILDEETPIKKETNIIFEKPPKGLYIFVQLTISAFKDKTDEEIRKVIMFNLEKVCKKYNKPGYDQVWAYNGYLYIPTNDLNSN